MRKRKRYFRVIAFLMAALLLVAPGMSVCAETIDSDPAVDAGQEASVRDPSSQENEKLEGDTEKDPEDDPEKNPGGDPEKDPEDDQEKSPEDDPEKTPGDDQEKDPEKDPEDDQEKSPEDDPEKTPEDDPEKDPGEDQEKNPEEDLEQNPEDDPEDGLEEDDEIEDSDSVEEEKPANKVLSEEKAGGSAAALTAPKNLQLDNSDVFSIVLTWDAVEGADSYEVYYAVDPALKGVGNLTLEDYKLLGTTEENLYESNLSENEALNPEHVFNHYPVEKQYYSYRVKAVRQQSVGQADVRQSDVGKSDRNQPDVDEADRNQADADETDRNQPDADGTDMDQPDVDGTDRDRSDADGTDRNHTDADEADDSAPDDREEVSSQRNVNEADDTQSDNSETNTRQTNGSESDRSSFSEAVSANGMYVDSLPYINSKRKAYKLPGSGEYVRFYLGDTEGREYNEANPIRLHQGESIDGLTLWAECADGSSVAYPKIRDAIAAYEKAHEPIFGNYKNVSYAETYGFTWFIAENLSAVDDVLTSQFGHISSFVKYAGNTVSDRLGFKAEQTTSETMYLAVAMNNSMPPDYGSIFFDPKNAMCFEFFVPVVIEEAEEGVIYDDLDASTICGSGEELWQTARQKIHEREEEFILLLSEEAYDAFLDKYGYRRYTEWEGEMHEDYVSLADDKITDTWLFTKYAEQDWMEPWAGDNLQDCIRHCEFTGEQTLLNGTYYHMFRWSAEYFTTAEQERELDAAIAGLLGEGGVLHEAYVSDNPLKKIQAAFSYTNGIKWVDGTKNPLNYTVYSGVTKRVGSCECFSLTFVRLCREMGINARVVKDNYWGGAGVHAWNIVEYRGLWYYVDCMDQNKFMKGSSKFNPKNQLQIYREKEFTDSHPISKTDYAMQKVTYYLNGGTNAPTNPISYEPGDVLTFAAPEKAGHTFEGWFADKAFRTLLIGPEGGTIDTSSQTGILNLYAKWKTNEYTLSYDMNVPAGAAFKTEVPVSGVTVKYNATVRLAANKSALYQYKFTGWNTKADGSGTAYKASASVKNLAEEGNCTLYAQWASTTYTVKYDSNASSLGLPAKGRVANTVMTFHSETNKTAANAFKIDGYKFTGWATRADGRGITLGQQKEADGTVSGMAVIGTALENAYAKDTNATVVLYAQWEAIPYTVELYTNDGKGTGPVSFTMNTGELLSDQSETAKITRGGYTLASWNTRADGKGKKYALKAKNLAKPGEKILLYAQWSKPISYKITYDLQGGKNAAKNPKSYTAANRPVLLTPTKAGHTFVKWVDAEEEDPDTAPAITVIPEKFFRHIKLRAVWSENSYKVFYHNVDAKYPTETERVEKDYKYTELADAITPAKEFVLKEADDNKVSISAWTTQPNGKGKAYAVGKGFSKLSADNFDRETDKGRIDLYAKWGTAVYKITYQNCDTADGVKNSAATSYTYNARKAVSIKAPTRTGYLFAGWTTPAGKDYFDPVKKQIKAGAAEDVVLTANWTPITYAVKLNLNVKDKGVSFKPNAQTVYGDTIGTGIAYDIGTVSFVTQDVVTIPAYYELTGWNTKANGKGIAADCKEGENNSVTSVNLAGLGTKNKGTVTLYAIWKPKTYEITYRHVDPENPAEEIMGVKVTNPSSYTYSASRAVSLKKPTRYGFVFEGWYTGYNATTGEYTNKVTSIPKGSAGDITLYGKWKVK